ncbi:ABC transporter substrate-binding protein [Bacillus sp. Hm123]|uniref:ABC transporter substrate-binding protein n=1 Tax=Bacillus sp. Hm123 TaxID=3450745 RepID=UPI003F4423ED
MKKHLLMSFLFLLSFVLLAACGNDNDSAKTKKEEKPAERVVKTVKGDVKVPVEPKRIADISGSTEELLIFGYTPIITANTSEQKIMPFLQDQLKDTKPVGSFWGDEINTDTILTAKPDLIIINNRQEKLYDQLSKIAPTVMLETDLSDWRPKFEEIARIMDKEEEANKWLKEFDEKAKATHDEILAKTGDDKFMVMAAYPNAFRVYGNYGYGSFLFEDLKLPAIEGTPTEEPLLQLQKEALIDYNPDYLFVFTTGDGDQRLKEFQESAIWKNMNAVKNNKVFMIAPEDLNKGYTPLGKELLLEEVKQQILEATK